MLLIFVNVFIMNVLAMEIKVDTLRMCDPSADYSLNFDTSFSNKNNKQYMNMKLLSKIPIGNQLRSEVEIYASTTNDQKSFNKLFTIRDKFCTIIDKYVGQFGYDLQKALGMQPGSCPEPAGNYTVRNYELAFANFRLKTFPVGYIKFVDRTYDIESGKLEFCGLCIVSNK